MPSKQKQLSKSENKAIKVANTQNSQLSVISNRFNIKDLMCPFTLDSHDLNHIKLLSKVPTFTRSFFINTLPRFLSFAKFLKPLYNFGNINTSVFINPIAVSASQSNLNTIINDLEIQKQEAIRIKDIDKFKAIQQKKLEAESLRDEIASNINRLFEVSILSNIYSNSLEELDAASELLGQEMSKSLTNIKSVWAEQEEAFKSNLPLGENNVSRNNTFDTYAVSTVFPFISSDISHAVGVPIAINKQTNAIVLLDNFNPSLPNYNIIILGKSGSGKRTAVKILAARSSVLDGVKNIALDADGRYRTIAESLDGINITLGSNTKIIINPFDIESEAVKDDITGRQRTILDLRSKINDVTNILMTMARGPIISEYVNNVTRKIIEETVVEEYKYVGIDSNPDCLYSSTGANLIGTKIVRQKKAAPTIGSWYKRLCRKAESNTNIDTKYHYEYLVKYMKDYVSEENGKLSFFDGQTTYDLTQEVSFINFDLSNLDSKFEKPLAQHIMLSWLYEKYMKSNTEDKTKAEKRRVIIDEAWMLLPYAESAETLSIMAQRAAKKNISLAILSKKFGEFYKNDTIKSSLLDCGIKLFMQNEVDELDQLKETFNLTSGERDFLHECLKGEGILQIGNNSAQIYIAPTGYEIDFIADESEGFIVAEDVSE
jgi:hypothetical protein